VCLAMLRRKFSIGRPHIRITHRLRPFTFLVCHRPASGRASQELRRKPSTETGQLHASGYSGVLTVFAIDSATGSLSLTSSIPLGNEFIKSSAVLTPNGRYLYQDDVYPDDVSPRRCKSRVFSTNAATGALSPVPGSPLSPTTHSGSSSLLMAIDTTGKFLYASYKFVVVNVGSDGGLAAYSIDPTSGALTAVPGSPFGLGGVPNSVAIDASGRFLIVSIFPRLGGRRGIASPCYPSILVPER
jgi:hypothetical protein